MKNGIKVLSIKIVKTMAETALSFITVGMAINEVNWSHILSVTVVAGVYTLLVNVRDLQEV